MKQYNLDELRATGFDFLVLAAYALHLKTIPMAHPFFLPIIVL